MWISSAGNKLFCTKVIGLHIIGAHISFEIVDIVISGNCACIITVMKGRYCDIAIYHLTFGCIRISSQIVLEDRRIIVKVEGQLRIVEE